MKNEATATAGSNGTATVEAGHCQICDRVIRTKTGRIAHHGFKRPRQGQYQGWQTASCFGARFRAFEVASDALPLAIAHVDAALANTEKELAAHIATPPAELSFTEGSWTKTTTTFPRGDFKRGDYAGIMRTYAYVYRVTEQRLAGRVKALTMDAAYLRARLAAWVAPAAV